MVQTRATPRSFPGWDAVPEDVIPALDETYDLGSANKRWAYLFAVIAVLTSIVIGGVVSISTLDSWLFINASTMVNGSLNISESLNVDENITADYYFGNGSLLTGLPTTDNESWNQSLADSLYADISVTGDNESWNQSLADSLYADISVTGDNESWNESYANTLYRADTWDNFTGIPHATPSDGDTTHFSLADEIYDWAVGLFLQAMDRTNIAMTNETNIFTKNQNLSSHNLTDIDCFIFDSGGKICSGV